MPNATEVACADKGFNVLMERDSDGRWMDKVILGELNMASLRRCVLGFVYGDYDTGLHELCPVLQPGWETTDPLLTTSDAVASWAGEHGFAFYHGAEPSETNSGLTEAWVNRINEALALRRRPCAFPGCPGVFNPADKDRDPGDGRGLLTGWSFPPEDPGNPDDTVVHDHTVA